MDRLLEKVLEPLREGIVVRQTARGGGVACGA